MTRNGSALVVHVVENPIVNRITFEGNHAVTDEKLRPELSLRPRAVYTAPDGRARPREADGATTPATAGSPPSSRRRSSACRRTAWTSCSTSTRAALTLISRISFVGNHAFTRGPAALAVITSAETAWWKFFSTDDEYNPEKLNFDKELLRRFYLRNGYIDFNVIDATAELSPDRKSFFITFTVQRGCPLQGRLGHPDHLEHPRRQALDGAARTCR